ncbi:MAG: hemerythrin family protein [Clostridia bacterium]|nr:hemerythrin family protein [Clostridia bacterium]
MFDWTDEYSLGVPSIDAQHQKLVAMGKDLQVLLQTHAGEDIYDELVAMIEALTDYTRYHFEYEESLMEKVGFEDLEDHKRQHREFVAKLEAIDFNDIDQDQETYAKDLLRMVSVWIFKHIIGTDAKYQTSFIDKGIE